MAILCFLKDYNNYSNRIIKRPTSYHDLDGYTKVIQKGINFNPNDNVVTEQIINWSESWRPNYLVFLSADPSDIEEEPEILERWFILDSIRTRKGQYNLELRRDVVSDNYDNVMEAPMMVNRGMVNYTNPLVFNNEGFSFNQIKKQETLIRNNENYYPYIVLYGAKNMGSKTGISVKADFTSQPDELLTTPLAQSIYEPNTYTSETQSMDLTFRFTAQYSSYGYTGNWRFYKYKPSDGSLIDDGGSPLPPHVSPITRSIISNNTTQLKDPLDVALSSSHMATVLSEFNVGETGTISAQTMSKYEEIIASGQKIVEDSTGKYYRVTVRKEPVYNNNFRIQPGISGYTTLVNYITSEFPGFEPNDTNQDHPELDYKPFYADLVSYNYIVVAEYLPNETFTVDVDPSGKYNTTDNESIVMLFPYWNVITFGQYAASIDKNVQLEIARTIAREYTNSVIFDMQLLPYAPPSIQKVANRSVLDIGQLDTRQFTVFSYNNNIKGVMLWADVSTFSFNINMRINVNQNAIDYKLSSNCDLWRLCSPNYNGQFEFNAAKNNGVNAFNIDVTYRPYNPYIHVNPAFNGIYGADFDDARGLICQGDFSLPITGDAFAQYELNNKNYLNIFNREIQHMEFTQRQESIAGVSQAIVGTVQGAAGGMLTGSMAGGAYGAVAGALLGAATSGIGGVIDVSMLKERQREDKALAKDMFSYKLGNIKALPYSLNKITPLTWNNKIFPFVEYYTCTDEEKNILRNRIKYDSMKLDCIDTLGNLMTNYTEDNDIHFYSGSIIRLEGVDNHEAEEIYNELLKGVYI